MDGHADRRDRWTDGRTTQTHMFGTFWEWRHTKIAPPPRVSKNYNVLLAKILCPLTLDYTSWSIPWSGKNNPHYQMDYNHCRNKFLFESTHLGSITIKTLLLQCHFHAHKSNPFRIEFETHSGIGAHVLQSFDPGK